jgi:hypothetical protein
MEAKAAAIIKEKHSKTPCAGNARSKVLAVTQDKIHPMWIRIATRVTQATPKATQDGDTESLTSTVNRASINAFSLRDDPLDARTSKDFRYRCPDVLLFLSLQKIKEAWREHNGTRRALSGCGFQFCKVVIIAKFFKPPVEGARTHSPKIVIGCWMWE